MGARDSSRTRVAPILTAVAGEAASREGWLARLLALPERDGLHPGEGIDDVGALETLRWGRRADGDPGEIGLRAPLALLEWLVRNVDEGRIRPNRPEIDEPRRRLAARDPRTVADAIAHLAAGTSPPGGTWHVLEGPTYPDAYVLTDSLVVVVEGKRTERGPTRTTTFMPVRDQLLRHMDAALDATGGSRRVLGFFAVEGTAPDELAVPPAWRAAVDATVSEAVVQGSLPHRTPDDRQRLVDGVLGAVTWQRVCATFGLPFPPPGTR